jgi:hypothetical protein
VYAPPTHEAVSDSLVGPETVTVTTPSPVEHDPRNVGVVLLVGVGTASSVSTGTEVSIANARVVLEPVFAAASVWDATALYEPSARAGEAATEKSPLVQAVLTDSFVGPLTATVTLPSPVVQVPAKVGVVLLEGDGIALSVTTGAVVSTTKVRVELVPVFPAASVWDATALYEPSARAGDAATPNDPAEHAALSVSLVGPVIVTVTAPSPVVQVPVSVGVVSWVGVATASSVTTGAVVSTTNVRVVLVPVLPAASVWDATALYEPSPRVGDATTEYAPLTHAAVRVWLAVPLTVTVTVPSPVVQVPLNVGAVVELGVATAFRVTTGAIVSITNDRVVLVPVLPAASVWVATAL